MAWNILPAYKIWFSKYPSNKMTAHKTHFLQKHESNMSNIVRSRLSLYACEISLTAEIERQQNAFIITKFFVQFILETPQ